MSRFRAAGMWTVGAALALLAGGCAPQAEPGVTAEAPRTAAEPGLFRPDPVRPVTHITIEPTAAAASGPQIIEMPLPAAELPVEVARVERLPNVPEEERVSPLPPVEDPPSYVPSAWPPVSAQPPAAKPVEPPKPEQPAAEAPTDVAPIPAEAPAPAPVAAPPARPAPRSAASLSPDRAATLAGVGRQVRQLAEHATGLAQRGAYFAARAEYHRALRLAAQALDTLHGTNEHARALTAGLRAIKEAGDFTKLGPADLEPDLANIVGGHRTPVLHDTETDGLTTVTGLQRYLTYAQQQLAASVQGVPEASLALYGLGRLEPLMNDRAEEQSLSSLNGPRSMAWHQAAMLVDSRNYRAANEMAVWLARFGQYADARRLLVQSLQVKRVPEAWHNLAVVHDNLGERDLALLARRELELAKSQPQAAGRKMVEWLEPEQFARGATPATTR